MKITNILPYICIVMSFLLTSNLSVAKNTVTRTAEYAPELPDTFAVRTQGLSNTAKGHTLNIMFDIRAKGTSFDIYSIELLIGDSIIMPLVPFSMSVGELETADSLVTWDCNIAFPYRDHFWDDNKWVLNTSRGQFGDYLIPESMRRNHAQKQLEQLEQRREMKKRAVAGIVLAVALILCIIDIYHRRKRKSLEAKLLIKQQFASKDRINAELREKVGMLYADRWNIFNQLCNEYFNKKDAQSENVRLSVYKELEKHIDDMRSTESLAELEQLLNAYNDNLMQRIRVQIPGLTKKDMAFLTYLYSGFSPRAICLFTDIKIKNFYNRRTRMRDKILASGAPDCEEFASKM